MATYLVTGASGNVGSQIVRDLAAQGHNVRATTSRPDAAGKRLAPQDTGLAASVGIGTVPVYRRLRLGLFFTGDELVMPGEPLPPGRIYNSNRFTLRGLAEALACELTDYGIVPDSLEATREVLRRAAAECDVVVTSAAYGLRTLSPRGDRRPVLGVRGPARLRAGRLVRTSRLALPCSGSRRP